MRVLGVDPGLQATGYGSVEQAQGRLQVLSWGTLRPRGEQLADRLLALAALFAPLLAELHPDLVALEELYSNYQHPRTAILMGHARGVICAEAARAGVPVTSYPASEVKRAVAGHGRATKEQVGQMVRARLGPLAPFPDEHGCDALALAVCHLSRNGCPRGRP
jgi:crossover junction endodeoxyribonuclease RuvC